MSFVIKSENTTNVAKTESELTKQISRNNKWLGRHIQSKKCERIKVTLSCSRRGEFKIKISPLKF